jgi:aryl-alcohol dehydrogenase-like predicted oxidoreductase
MTVEYRFMGNSGLRVSALSFGAATFGGDHGYSVLGSTQEEEAAAQVRMCLDAGVNLFDTADAYSLGRSEEILGAALGKHRDEVLISTKVNGRMSDDPNDVGQSRHHIIRAVEASLRRLGTDWIDIYHVHGYDGRTPLEESLRALDDLVTAGKVRYLGCSNFSGWHLMKALATADAHGWSRFVSQQMHYSLLARDLEHELVPLALDQGVGVLVWSPLSNGWLSGKFRRGAPRPAGARVSEIGGPNTIDEDRAFRIVEVLAEVAAAHPGASVAQVALGWLLNRRAVTSVIVGARTRDQLADNLAAADLVLSADEVRRLDEVSAQPLPYPYWHQAEYDAERIAIDYS